VRLEQSLVLNRFFHSLFGARRLEEMKQALRREKEGPAGDGQSHFCGALAGLRGLRVPTHKLQEYDRRVMGYEARLGKARGRFTLKYFQYLCLLYAEIFLDRLTDDPARFLRELNAFLHELKREETSLREFDAFTAEDLRRLAFFMATGSGKTLLLHANLWQVLHYLDGSRHPEALVSRADGRREFDTILLITPNEGLSAQHISEFERSGIEAALLVQDRTRRTIYGPQVNVIEIHKLAEEPSKEGVSVLLEELGGANLVFVDEGHKGTGSEARTWKTRQRQLSGAGFLLEYSATFAQAIGAASARVQEALPLNTGKPSCLTILTGISTTTGTGRISVCSTWRGRVKPRLRSSSSAACSPTTSRFCFSGRTGPTMPPTTWRGRFGCSWGPASMRCIRRSKGSEAMWPRSLPSSGAFWKIRTGLSRP